MAFISTSTTPLTLDNTAFDLGATAGTVIGAFRGKTPGSVLIVRPQDGRVAIRGNDTLGFTLAVGYTASSVGPITVSIKEANPQVPSAERVTTFTIRCRKALPTLPLASGARVMGLGHSFIQRSWFSRFQSTQTASAGMQGHAEGIMRGVLSWVKYQDQRFDISTFPDGANQFQNPSSTNALTGAAQAQGGDHLNFNFPGTLARTPYSVARAPHIVYLHIGENEINSDGYTSAAPIISLLDEQLRLLRDEGIWVVVQTIQMRDPALWNATQLQMVVDLNTWIAAQSTRTGVKVCDTRSVISDTVWDPTNFGTDGIHWNSIGAQKASTILLPVLQSMVSSGSIFNTDATVSNLYANGTFIGTTGTKGTGINAASQIATGWTAALIAGTGDTIVGSKEDITAGVLSKQVFTITPNNDATLLHFLRLTQTVTTPFTLSAMGIADGDWIEAALFIELSAWNAWTGVAFQNELQNASGFAWEGNSGNGVGDSTTQVLPTMAIAGWAYVRFQVFPGIGLNAFRCNSRPIDITYRSDRGGSGVVKVSQAIYRKITNPMTAWNL